MFLNVVTFILAILCIGIGIAMAVSVDRSIPGQSKNRVKPAGAALIFAGLGILLVWAYVVNGAA